MNALFAAITGSFIRWGLTILATYLVEHGVWTTGNATDYVTGLTLAIVTLLWSFWDRYKSRIKFLTALESPGGTTEAHIDEKIAFGLGATLTPEK